ncbi:hypothetical protein PybrP1_002589 [[Pythium] brassicae (nom. inval.)]|nr:hypothetical protein PybrP1_002589 [[Pythium] brassicae (nom. inval.)]
MHTHTHAASGWWVRLWYSIRVVVAGGDHATAGVLTRTLSLARLLAVCDLLTTEAVPESVELPRVLGGVADLAVEEDLDHPEERGGREQRVRARLMHRAYSLDLEVLGEAAEAAHLVKVHGHVLEVERGREVRVQQVEERLLLRRQRRAREHLEQVAKVGRAVERDPLDVVAEHEPGGHEQLAEARDLDAHLLVLGEVDARLLEHLDRVLRVHVLAQAELEVELPHGYVAHEGAVLVEKRHAQLDDAQQVDVAAQRLVLVVGRGRERADGPRHHARVLRVHGHVALALHHLADQRHGLLQVACPHVADLHVRRQRARRQHA